MKKKERKKTIFNKLNNSKLAKSNIELLSL